MIKAALILAYALNTNEPLYLNEAHGPYRDYGVRLEVSKPLKYGFRFFIAPYVARSKDHSYVGSGGAILRIEWEGKDFGIAYHHNSEHNFDRGVIGGDYKNIDLIEFKWKLE